MRRRIRRIYRRLRYGRTAYGEQLRFYLGQDR